MKLFFLKLMWQITPVALVLILLILLGLAWFYWLKDFWEDGSLKRLIATCLSAVVVCSCMVVLMGFSTQSKLPFGKKIENISAEQIVIKEQKELISELDSAILVANDQKLASEDVAAETITTDWLASYRAKISKLSDPEVRESYAKRFDNIEHHFYAD